MSRHLRSSCVLIALFMFSAAAFAQLNYNMTFLSHPPGSPGGLVVADMNRDGKLDLAYVHGSTVSVQFGGGSGNFGSPHDTALASGSLSVGVLAADLNKDGKIDLVVLQASPMQAVVLLGNGDGTFAPPLSFTLVNTPYAMALGDINNDGKLDLAVRECSSTSSSGTCDVAIYLGQGDGTFAPGAVLSTPGAATLFHSLALTDFNRDGKLDLAVAALGGSSSAPTANFKVFFGHGDGTFSAPKVVSVPYTVPANFSPVPPTLVAGDFNGDAVDDVAVETGSFCGGSACGQSKMNIFLNNGSGSFTLHSSFASASDESPSDWVAGDLNNDLKIDLMRISPSLRTGSIRAYLNNGSGTFTQTTSGDEGFTAAYAVIRDINLDGRHDLAAEEWDFGDSDLSVQTNSNGTPNCPPPLSGALHAKICTPTGSSVSSTTFTVKASGNSPVGIKRLELWVDGVKRAQALDDQLRRTLTLSAGSHTLTVIAVDQYSGSVKTTKTVSVP